MPVITEITDITDITVIPVYLFMFFLCFLCFPEHFVHVLTQARVCQRIAAPKAAKMHGFCGMGVSLRGPGPPCPP